MTIAPSRLLKLIKPPSKIANELDWKKARTIALLDIGKTKIGLAVGSHPEFGERIQTYEPLNIKMVTTEEGSRRVLAKTIVKKLESMVKENNVCGVICLWPLEPASGRAGFACGKVLHTLECLAEQSSTILTPGRPVGLWATDFDRRCTEDEWGRSPLYSRTTTKKIHRATEQYFHHEGSSAIASQIYESFCQRYWPDLWEEQEPVLVQGKQVRLPQDVLQQNKGIFLRHPAATTSALASF